MASDLLLRTEAQQERIIIVSVSSSEYQNTIRNGVRKIKNWNGKYKKIKSASTHILIKATSWYVWLHRHLRATQSTTCVFTLSWPDCSHVRYQVTGKHELQRSLVVSRGMRKQEKREGTVMSQEKGDYAWNILILAVK